MEINRTNSAQSFGSIYGDAKQISKLLGKKALNVIMEQKHNVAADIFVSAGGFPKVVAKDGHSLKIPYEEKSVNDIGIYYVKDEWLNSYAEGMTSSGEKVKMGFYTASLDPGEKYEGIDKKMIGALRIADNAYYDGVSKRALEPTEQEMEKAVASLLDLNV